MVDAAEQRHNMVESQVRPSDITDRRIIRAMQNTPRERFLPPALQSLAYTDGELMLPALAGAETRFELAPRTLAKLIQEAEIEASDVVLDVGAATGYSSALLSQLCDTVLALEERKDLAERASDVLTALEIDTVAGVTGPLTDGYPSSGPYDVIVVEGGVQSDPTTLLAQLKDGGRLVAVLLHGAVGRGCCWRRQGEGFSKKICFDATAHLLPGFGVKQEFSI